MPATVAISEETVHRVAPDAQAVQAGRDLLRKKKFMKPAVSKDGTWLLAQCQGSGKEPYEVSCDLADPSAPVGRCTCPSRKFPCKHAIGLMLAYIGGQDTFAEREPPPELLAKREKQEQRKEKKAEAKTTPRKVNQAALTKKAAAQREGLDLLEKLLLDLVAAGQWFEASRLERLDRQAKQLTDAYLPGAMHAVRSLVLLGQREDLADDARNAQATDLIGKLWATVQRGRNYLDGKLAGDETQSEADAVIEEVLGRVWQLAELREKGYFRQDLSLLELAYERLDNEARQERVETSHLLDLKDGNLYQAIAYRPFKGMKFVPEQSSYLQPLQVKEAAVYPGFPGCQRVRWEKPAEQSEPLQPAHLKKAYGLAQAAFEPVLAAFRKQLKNPLAPSVTHALLRCQNVGRVGEHIILEDEKGIRIETGAESAGEANVSNLVRAAGMLKQPAVLARLFVRIETNTILAKPLAALTAEHHLRLGI